MKNDKAERPNPPGDGPNPLSQLWRPAAALLASGGSCLVVAPTWPAGLLAALASGTIACALAWPRNGAAARPVGTGSQTGATLMVSEVVPVWQRHLEASKAEAEKGVGGLLQSFGNLSDGLSQAAQHAEKLDPSLSAGATDDALNENTEAVESLLEPMRTSRNERDAMVSEMLACSERLAELNLAAKEVREVARHTHLVAFNASIHSWETSNNLLCKTNYRNL